ncbi:peptide chain release factor aRF-1 [Candidatus Woesearchaeota archaeon]|nr:peptide chain release factor aRF-1 [Candidatus Woesearchaeota archaeon]
MAVDNTKLKRFIRKLESARGRHTELVSVYIPAGYDLNRIITSLSQEQGTAANIKDKNTRQNVIDSLERMIRHLRLFGKTPENGLAVFSGNASEREDKVDIQVWSIEPPIPLKIRMYRCDQTYVTEPLKEMMETKECYGLVTVERQEASIGLLKGSYIQVLTVMTSGIPGKTRAGGQSAPRFARIREGMTIEFFKRIADAMNQEFLPLGNNLRGIIVGGPGPTKENMVNGNYINQQLKDKIIGIKDLCYSGEEGLREMVDRSEDLLAQEIITKEKNLMRKFLEILSTNPGRVAYGVVNVENSLNMGAVDTLLISEDLNDAEAERLEDLGIRFGAKVETISIGTMEGMQLRDLGKIAAILRFSIT